jgi:quercetin dioxygenase-like cupin family protein
VPETKRTTAEEARRVGDYVIDGDMSEGGHDGEDEGMWLDHVEVHLVTHPVGQVKEMHVHDPPQDHVIVMRSGRMRWTVEDQTLDAQAGDVIVTPAGTAHGYEVLGDEPARVVCIDSPKRPKPES